MSKKNHRTIDDKMRPTISMLVAAYNEDQNIKNKIENFLALDYPRDNKELLIGSDGSTDRTNEILETLEIENIKSFIYNYRSGKAAILNRLAKEAQGEILIFSDANTIYSKNAVLKLVRHFVNSKVGGVCGNLSLVNPNNNTGGKGEQLYWGYENNLKRLEGNIKSVLGANGAIYALRKKLYHNLPEDKVVMDDFLIPLYAVMDGYDVLYDEEACATETTSPHLKGEFERKTRIGAANFNSLPEIKSLLNPKKGFVAFALWSHKMIRWFAPFLLLAIFVSNIFLINQLFFSTILILQILFYAGASIGHLFIKKYPNLKILTYPLYFCAVNLALGIGFVKFITKSQKPAWSRIERS